MQFVINLYDYDYDYLLRTFIQQAGNIAELLLREGFARCVDWSMAVLSKGHDKLRAAEK